MCLACRGVGLGGCYSRKEGWVSGSKIIPEVVPFIFAVGTFDGLRWESEGVELWSGRRVGEMERECFFRCQVVVLVEKGGPRVRG